MKKTALSLLLLAIITTIGCKRETVNIGAFVGNEWYSDSILVIRNDSSVSFSKYDSVYEQLIEQKALPLQLTDSTMVFSRYEVTGSYDLDRNFHPSGCVLVSDTVKYDIKYINKRPKLIIYVDPFPIILSSRNRIKVEETNNFNPVKFEISNFSIGDQIDRSLLKTLGVYNYANYTIEDCEYINDKNISFKIIGYNNIFSIERRKIEDYRIKDIMNVVTSKLNNAPGYSPMRQWSEDSNYEYEFYRWETNGVRIDLSRSHYIGNDSYKTLLNTKNWNLSYDDVILQAILVETYKNGNPTSSIIN